MSDHTAPQILTDTWVQQRLWSETANRLKHRLDRARTTALVLAITAAVLAVAATQLTGPPPWLAPALGAGAAIAAGIATLAQTRAGTDQIRTWTRARSVSEGLKTEIYSYLAGGTHYTHPADRDRTLDERTGRILANAEDLAGHTAGVNGDNKPLPAVAGVQDYITHRVNHQIDKYYRPKADHYQHRVQLLRGLGTALGVATVVLSAVAASFALPAAAAWVPVATTAATAVAAHVAAARYDHLIIEYARTAQRLEQLRKKHLTTPGDDAAFIDACENAISVENQGWMAYWTTDNTSQPGPPPTPSTQP